MTQSANNLSALKQELLTRTAELGFCQTGIVPVPVDLRSEYFYRWLETGQHGTMAWMARDAERRTHPEQVLPQARSIIVCGFNYYQPEPQRRGRIAKYALGKDYHKILLKKLKIICLWLQENGGINRPYVDTGPILEKPLGELAGIGWQGKNTVLLNAGQGQWMFLGTILTSIAFPPDQPPPNRCGSCTRCIDVCPTKAITAPYQLDARKCISYLTIEHKGSIPEHLRPLIGDHLFGCDDCLDICPWNRWAQQTREAKFDPRPLPDLRDMLFWDTQTFNDTFAGTPIRRLGLHRWLRNICTVLGNTGNSNDLPAIQTLTSHPDPMVSEHARWAIDAINRIQSVS